LFVKVPKILQNFFPKIVWRHKTHEKKIWLTFDDGPDEKTTNLILEILKKLNIKANDCVAIEDTQESLNSARRAKIKCIIFPGKFHSSKKFIGAYKKVYRLNKNIILR